MSSASRWLASLLHNHDSAQAISFPEVSEDGFAAVIAYVYGAFSTTEVLSCSVDDCASDRHRHCLANFE